MIVVTELDQTCRACPSQWEGRTDDGNRIYIRYRHGWLSAGVGRTMDDAIESAFSAPVHSQEYGEAYDGVMPTNTMVRCLRKEVVFNPEALA